MSEKNKINTTYIFKALVLACILTLILALIISAVYLFTNITDDTLSFIVFAIPLISVFASSIIFIKNVKQNGLIHGFLIGITYFIILFLISYLSNKQLFISKHMILTFLSVTASGGLGGLIAINSNENT